MRKSERRARNEDRIICKRAEANIITFFSLELHISIHEMFSVGKHACLRYYFLLQVPMQLSPMFGYAQHFRFGSSENIRSTCIHPSITFQCQDITLPVSPLVNLLCTIFTMDPDTQILFHKPSPQAKSQRNRKKKPS